MTSTLKMFGAAIAAVALMGVSAHAAPIVAGTFVTDPSQVASAPIIATSGSTAATDAISLRLANDGTNVYVYLTYNSAIDGASFLAIDSDNNPTTGDAIYGSPSIGSNFGLQYATGFTQTAAIFNTDPSYYGTPTPGDAGSTTPTTFAEATTATTIMYTIPLSTSQSDNDAGGFNGSIFPTSNFTIEAWQNSGNVVGPVEYTIATATPAPEPASLSLLALGAVPLLRRRAKLA